MVKQKQSQKLINQIKITLADRRKRKRSRRKPSQSVGKQPLPLQTNLPLKPQPNKSLLDVQLEAERNKNRNTLLGNRLSNIENTLQGQTQRIDEAIKEISKRPQSSIQPVKQETSGFQLLRPPVSPGTQAVQANESLKEYLKQYKSYIPKKKTYTDEDIDKLQGNQLNKLYQQTREVIDTAQTPAKLKTGQLEPLDPDFDARYRSAQKFLQDRMAEVEQMFQGEGAGGGLGGLFDEGDN